MRKLGFFVAVAAALIIMLSASAFAGNRVSIPYAIPSGGVQPAAMRGPLANLANDTTPGYGLFKCQLGLSTGQCYDPYQMRHAYNIDRLISAGYTGSGFTIVIIDAFQSPNIVQQLNT